MTDCSITMLVGGLLILMIAILIYKSGGQDNFYVPYYTTTFQAYPGKFMNYSSDRNSYCLQQHQEYSGYRNCMLYLE